VRERARQEKKERFTALLHHVSIDLLRASFSWLKRDAAPGVDGLTWQEYEQNLEVRLEDLHARVHRGAYRAQPSRRKFIPKGDGQRPLGVASLEDKIVQRAVVEVLNAIYEEDFLGFSYGFRPGRGQHHALDALAFGITRTKVNYILDYDVRSFFDSVSHEWLLRFIEHRIGDPRVIRLIRKWLKAGVMDNGTWSATETGTPQGSVASPTLANVYLHYCFDLWAEQWRHGEARGNVIYVRYADDIVVGFEHQDDAQRFLEDLHGRLEKFALKLHPEKTRLIEFGRFLLKRKSRRDRMRSKLRAIKAELRQRLHEPIPEQGKWLAQVVRGYFAYHAVPTNARSLGAFLHYVKRLWQRALRCRSQKDGTTWERVANLAAEFLPKPRVLHPWPDERFQVEAECLNRARSVLFGGRAVMRVPTEIVDDQLRPLEFAAQAGVSAVQMFYLTSRRIGLGSPSLRRESCAVRRAELLAPT